MWWRTVLAVHLLAIIHNSIQLDGNGTEAPQCCPCPAGPASVGPGPVDSAASLRGEDVEAAGPAGLEPCPCLARDADSEGAASMMFPHAVGAFGTVMRSDPKEDAKPLLHPEVDLASSVLETLREATDEEYREALERDAARAAAPDAATPAISNGIPQETRNVVTIIVSPQDMDGSDDIISDASHVQETRCIHPSLTSSRASFNYRPSHQNGLEEILNLPLPGGLLHRQRDSNLAASEVRESVIKPDNNLNRLLSGLKLRSDPSLFSLTPNKISDNINNRKVSVVKNTHNDGRREPNINNIVVSKEKDNVMRENIADEDCVNNFSPLNNDSDRQSVFREEDVINDLPDFDSDTSPSNIEEQMHKSNEEAQSAKFSSPLNHLFKLKDVELVPFNIIKKIPKSKPFISDLKFDSFHHNKARTHAFDPVKIPTLKDLFGKPSKLSREKAEKENNDIKSDENPGHIQTIARKKEITTEILDTVPSPSEINSVVTAKEDCLSLNEDSDKSANNAKGLLATDTNETVESDPGIESDSMTNEGDFTDITDLEITEETKSENGGGTQNDELSTSEDFNVIDSSQTMDRNSDSETLIISSEDISDVPNSSVDFSELSEPEERNNEVDKIHPLRTLEEIRKSVVDKLDALQVNNRNALNNIRQSMEEISERSDFNGEVEIEARDLVSSKEQFPETEPISDSSLSESENADELKDVNEEVSFADLQSMSDSILEASEKKSKEVELAKFSEEKETDLNESNETETGNISRSNELEQVQNKEFESGIKTSTSNSMVNQEDIVHNKDISLCPSDFVKESSSVNIDFPGNQENGNINNDLEPLASEPIVNSILRPNSKSLVEHLSDLESKLRQNLIVQPSTLINTDSLNIFKAPTLRFPDISELDTNIPTLDEVRARVSEILGGLARQAGDEEVSSELDSDDFASNLSPMLSTGASSPNPVSILSPLRPLEDINLDIVQLKPIPLISRTNPLRAELPGLNLNAYKAKLAVPKSLHLKPLKLASTLGNGGGLVGARLSIEPKKKVKASKGKIQNSNRSWEKDQGKIGATLADMTERINSNTQNLLNLPKSVKKPTLQARNALGNIAENLKSHTENSLRNIHHSINIADLSNTIQENTRNMLKSPLKGGSLHNNLLSTNSIDTAIDNIKSQSENTFRNVQNSLSMSPLPDINDSVRKVAKKLSMSSAVLTPGNDRLEKTIQTIPSIGGVVNNLLSQTESAMKNVQRTLNVPALSDRSISIQKSAQNLLQSPIMTTRTNHLKSPLQPSSTLDNVVDNLKSQSQSTMRHIHQSLSSPILSDISSTMQKHAEDLLKSPMAAIGRDTLASTLKAPAPLDLKPHAEKAVKDLQKTLKATLRNSPVKDFQQFTNPKNIIDMITNHQEDVNDKLFAIHTDLNDRLESIHNDITDPERLKSILSPPSNRHFEMFTIPLPSSRMSAPSSKKQARPVFKTKQPNFGQKLAKPRLEKTSTSNIARHNPGATARAGKERDSFKMPKAASAPVPARTNRPLSPSIPKKPIISKSSSGDSLKKPSLSQPDILKGLKKPLLPKHKPLFENKIKVTFGPTTLRPIPAAPVVKAKPMGAPPTKPKTGPKRFKPKPPVRQPTPWSEWGEARTVSKPDRKGDSLTSPSKSIHKFKILPKHNIMQINKKSVPAERSQLASLSSRLKPQSLGRLNPQAKLKTSVPQGRSSNRDSKLLSPEKPSLLSKLTEALKNKQTKANLRSPGPDLDVAQAPSDQVEKVVTLGEHMKENVAYKCKMMCVKLD